MPPSPETALVPSEELSLTSLADRATDYARHAKAENTLLARRSDWKAWRLWCDRHGREPLPAAPETVALYLADQAEVLKPSTLSRRLSSISQAHQAAGYPTPTTAAAVRMVWQGICRTRGVAQAGKAPVMTGELRRMVDTLPAGLLGVRDRALLVVGFAGCFRRSEIVGLDREDVRITPEGVTVQLRRSKTDQLGAGATLGLPYGARPETCPVRTLAAWLKASKIESGPLFRPVDRHGNLRAGRLTGRSVARIVQRAALAAGLNPALVAGHSLRIGHATSAHFGGADERTIMRQGRWKSERTLRRYIRDADLWRANSAAHCGL